MKNYKSFHQEFGTDCMRVYRLKSDNFYSRTILSQWNPGSIQISGKIPIHFNGARISSISVFFHSSLIFVTQLSGRLLSAQVKITAFYSYVSGFLSVFSPKKKPTKNTKRVRKCYAYLQCYIIHFIAQSKDEKNCLLHLLGEGQKCKQKG